MTTDNEPRVGRCDMEPKLLTEEEARDLYGRTGNQICEMLRERGLIGPEPVTDAFDVAVINALETDGWSFSTACAHNLAGALRDQGMELQREAQPALTPPRFPVPKGQTPLDDNLHHRLLDVIREGMYAFDSKAQSPYHDHSLERYLHVWGWVIRDLRLALDAAQARFHAAALAQPPRADKGVGHG